jgi:hypothetical protein
LIEDKIVNFIIKRIINFEDSIAKTRKGIKNYFTNILVKKSDRLENDGLKESFKMNKSELELRNLCDLAFVFQDYETAKENTQYPLKDFKSCKAFKYAASC